MELKKLLNEEMEVSLNVLYNKFAGTKGYKSLKTVSFSTIRNYIKVLEDCDFVFRSYRHTFQIIVLKYKIPDKLTYKEARTLSKNPWMVWFKYPQIHINQRKENK
jgi:hypothetical protein